ncbi:hypothetical protein ACWT_1570 [Actinoplanes sp. SE50]|uniref:SCO2522 family protein n=1 Tax=unclassified Actinoplanes TaxID=2626549 RepID=UPI00023EC904|nr:MULTISPECIES: SCO2522 family protein [unclassified Actinoplanes]AEV82589.1 hypothetical protein ACPL_1692 [Actinoplanes sp. SE50/110]ATO80985.1 hypothetical protein ACWT_1570 [Actinoplanes sp. SE50]SLL98392.1 hypothetical protein ACSP50_1618 [Actinoplanes sp. SE50/110]
MTGPQAHYEERSAQPRVEQLPLAHLSIELGHLYKEDFAGGIEQFRRHFRQIRPYVAAARDRLAGMLEPGRTPRVSTCFMIDDYFDRFEDPPAAVVDELVKAAAENDLTIDYLAREAGCARAGEVSPAELVLDRLVADPPPGTDGVWQPPQESGWLTNGDWPPGAAAPPAMSARTGPARPTENARNRHSVFFAVEIFSTVSGSRLWACPHLAAVWQLMRLGLLRHHGRPVAPARPAGEIPATWAEMPAVLQLNAAAAPFHAYRTHSVLARRFLNIETAVGIVLSQVAVDEEVRLQVARRAAGEGFALSDNLLERIAYVFDGETARLV